MVSRKALGLLSGLLLLGLTACSSIGSGYITNKEIHPAYTWIQYVCSSYNSKGFCQVQTPIFHNEPERYSFDIKEGEDEGWVYVGYSTFQSYNVGDYYKDAND